MYFYLPNTKIEKISPELSGHFFSCRVKNGDILNVTDLKGNLSKIELVEVNKKTLNISCKILESTHIPKSKNSNILLQAAPEKLYLEKLCEIAPLAGIQKILLFASDFSPKQNIPTQRLEKILIRSCEQGQIIWKPEIHLIRDKKELKVFIRQLSPVVLNVDPIGTLKDISANNNPNNNSVLIGPEGGWSENELHFFKEQNLEFASLGDTVYPAWLAGFVWFVKV